MQNRYVGDIGDFAKYALLRSIGHNSKGALLLAIIWYLYPDEIHNSDGRHVSYLDSSAYRALDPELHAAMTRLVRGPKRNVAEVKKAGVLPPETVFFDDPIVGQVASGMSRKPREALRTEWFARAKAATVEADVVFFDPDNGIEARSVPKYAPKAGKYVFWDEIEAIWTRGQSLLIYHHLNRTATVAAQAQAARKLFTDRLSSPPLLQSLLFRRGSCRHFWVVGQNAHASELQSRINALLGSGWGGYFEVG